MARYKAIWLLFLLLLVTGCTSCGGGAGKQDDNNPPPQTTVEFDSTRAFADLERQCEFGPRIPGSQAHANCLAWLVQQLGTADQVVQQPFESSTTFGGPYNFTNVLAIYGKDKPGVPFLLCAHWDCRPKADEDPDPANQDKPVPGANDGASGVAVLLELARLMATNPPPRPIIIAMLDAEDSGQSGSGELYSGFCLGAKYLATHWPSALAKPTEGVLLDLVGGDDVANPRCPPRFGGNNILDFPIERNSQNYNPTLVSALWTIADERGHTAFKRTTGSSITDDHLPLNAGGIKVIDIIDFPPPEWHTIDDTPANCSAAALYQTGDTLARYIWGD
ncbi:MAG: M28 family peptidase [Armatimonadia bacterium]